MIFGGGGFGYVGLQGDGSGTPAPPFALDSADNGLSVDPITGRIVAGNDVGGTGAELLSHRQIPLNGFDFEFVKSIGTTFFSGGVNSGLFSDVTSDNFYTAYTAINRSTGTGAITYSGVYNDNLNALFLIATGSNYNQGASSYDANTLLLYADSLGPTADLAIAGDGNIRFLTQGLNRQFEKMTLFGVSGNLRIGFDGLDDFSAKLQVVGDGDNISNFCQSDGTSRAVVGNTGNWVFGNNASSLVDNGQALQLYLDNGQPGILIRDSSGTDLVNLFSNGRLRIGAGSNSNAMLQVRGAASGNIAEFLSAANTAQFIVLNNGQIQVGMLPARASAGDIVQRGPGNILQRITGASGGPFTAITSITVVDGIITAITGT